MLHPELSGECKHTNNLDTKCPETVQKMSRVCPNVTKDKIQGHPKIKHADWMIFARHRRTKDSDWSVV